MIRKTVVMLAGIFFLSQAIAQNLEYGIKGGFNLGTPYGVSEEGATGSPGFGPLIGAFFKYSLNDIWAVHMDFSYSQKGSTFDTPVSGDTAYHYNTITSSDTIPSIVFTTYRGRVQGKFDNRYLDIPMYMSWRFSRRFSLLFGPEFSYLISGKNTGTADIEVGDPAKPFTNVYGEPFDQSNQLNKWDYSILVGVWYEGKRRLVMGLTITTGLGSIYKKNYKYIENTVRNIYMQGFFAFKISRPREE